MTPRNRALLAATLASAVAVSTLPATTAGAHHIPPVSGCILVAGHRVSPTVILAGETVTVQVRAAAVCAGVLIPMHVVAVVAEASTLRAVDRDLIRDATHLLTRVMVPTGRLGVVGRGGDLACRLTVDDGLVRRCVNRALDPSAPREAKAGSLADAVAEAGRVLAAAHWRYATPTVEPREVAVVFGPNPPASGCAPLLRQARALRRRGALVMTACTGPGCDGGCLAEAATSPRYAAELRRIARQGQWFSRVIPGLIMVRVRRMRLVYPLPEGVEFEPGSLSPLDGAATGAYDQAAHTVTWTGVRVPLEGVTVTLGARIGTPGVVTFGRGARVEALDTRGRTGVLELAPDAAQALGSPP